MPHDVAEAAIARAPEHGPNAASAAATTGHGEPWLDCERLDCYRVAVEFQTLAARLITRRGLSALRDHALPASWAFEIPTASAPAEPASSATPGPSACARDSAGFLAHDEFAKLAVEGAWALPRVLSVNVRNGSGCTVRELYVAVEGAAEPKRLGQSGTIRWSQAA